MKKRILTSGVESEYVLSGLCQYLRDKSWDVTELDFGVFKKNPHDILQSFVGQDTIYITSAHSNLTLRIAEVLVATFKDLYPNYMSPLDIIRAIKPSVSIYIPHDLLAPYGETNLNEFRCLDLFDYILAPTASPELQATLGKSTKVIDAGWIKYAGLNTYSNKSLQEENNTAPKVTLFISMIEHLRWRYGVDGFVKYFLPLLKSNVRVKLPAWEGVEEIESAFKAQGLAEVVPAMNNSIDLIINSDVVICNGASSIHAEAALVGCPTICLLDNEAGTVSEQKNKLKNFPDIYFHDYRTREPISDSIIESLKVKNKKLPVKIFDYAVVERIIESADNLCEVE